jgi:ribose 5-phosphate isomerase B
MEKNFMRIAIGADHGGFLLKQKLIGFLESRGYAVADMGTHSTAPCDYPVYGAKVAKAVASGQFQKGILICKSGIGMSMVANKIPGIRAALCWDIKGAESSRLHNDANIICLADTKTAFNLAKKMLEIWLNTGFEGGRHLRRVKQMEKIERCHCEP